MTSSPLHETLAVSIPDLRRHCRDPWVVIGSAAVALAGVDVSVADVDVLTSKRDAEGLIALWRARLDDTHEPMADSDRFRSHFARFRFPGLPLEVMGGLELNGSNGWQPVHVDDVVRVICAGVDVPIPALSEQIRILESFARPKDLQRAARLRVLAAPRPADR
jgi:hypothetical protein